MGIELAIPMPGHPIPPTAVDSVRAQLGTLEKLVDEHDVVYLLMDSRESRWLPTVMGAAKGKVRDEALNLRSSTAPVHRSSTESAVSRAARHERCPWVRHVPCNAARAAADGLGRVDACIDSCGAWRTLPR